MAELPSSLLAKVEALYDAGRYAAAHDAGAELGDLRAWPEVRGRVMAARLGTRLGASRLAQALLRAAFQMAPRDPHSATYYGGVILARRGAWHGLRWIRERAEQLSERTPDFVALEGYALARLRDFERARARIDEAAKLAPESSWIAVQRSVTLELEDRVEEALSACEEALSRRPGYRPALLRRAQLLTARGRTEEAIAALDVAPNANDSWELLSLRAELHHTLSHWAACLDDLERARSAAKLADRALHRELDLRSAEALYLLRRYRAAEPKARAGATPFGRAFAAALAELNDGDAPPRVELAGVPHIRQRHSTCAPASLAQVAGFHRDPVDHLELAETICYEGTPAHRQRTWAAQRGYVVRELDLTLEATRALIDAGLPFLLLTAGSDWAHAQVVIGYDLARRGLLVRDPGVASLVEMNLDSLATTQAWHGPRAMVLAPSSHADALEGMVLPNARLYDLRYRIDIALYEHDLERAEAALAEMLVEAPASRHALESKLAIAWYRGRVEERIESLDALLKLHPGTPAWVLQRGEAMRGRRPRAERLGYWRSFENVGDPALLESLADDLRSEATSQEEAARLLRRALRINPGSGFAHHAYASLCATRGENAALVLEAFRFAVTNAEAAEHYARAYFNFARLSGRDAEALALLEGRAARAGARASGPAQTLFEIHADQGNPERGVELLQQLARQRPTDGDLLTTLVDAHLTAGDVRAARKCLDDSRAVPRHFARRAFVEAAVCRAEADLDGARAILDRGIVAAPSDIALLSERAHLAEELEGRAAAIAILSAAYERMPSDGAILTELCTRLRGSDDARARTLLETRVAEHPDDQWSRRELALVLSGLGRLDEAIVVARAALETVPHDSWACSILGGLLDRADAREEAREALRLAVSLDVDNTSAIEQLERRESTREARCEDARYVLDVLGKQVSAGPGLIAAAHLAFCLGHDERTARLTRLLERAPQRPDAWEVVARAHLEAGDLDAAAHTVSRARERFPRWFSLMFLSAEIASARGDWDAAERELREICAQSPLWIPPRVRLASILADRGANGDAIALVEEGLQRFPRSLDLRMELAFLHWKTGERERAFASTLALADEHFEDLQLVEHLSVWAQALGRLGEVEALVARRAEADRKSAVAPLRLGRMLTDPARLEERLAALREAVARSPRYVSALDALAEALAEAKRWNEALLVCPPPGWTGPVPIPIRGRRAWIQARQGQAEAAIEEMLKVLDDDPSYSWGRRCLCDWLDELGRRNDFLTHARALVRHEPTQAVNHLYLADACLRAGERNGAIEAFDRALTLSSRESYAAERLVEMLLEDGRARDALARIDRVRHVLPRYEIAKLEVDVALYSNDRDGAFQALDTLLASAAPLRTLELALGAFAQSQWGDEALERVEARLATTDMATSGTLVDAWTTVREKHRPDGALRMLARKESLGRAARVAIGSWIVVLASSRSWLSLAWIWIRHRAWIRSEVETWAAYGNAFWSAGWVRTCVWWLSDWRERSGVQPWMLMNLVVALWRLNRAPKAAAVVAGALELPADHTTNDHRAYWALHSALAGDVDTATSIVSSITFTNAKSEGLVELARVVIAAYPLGGAPDPQELADAVGVRLARARELALTHGGLFEPYRVTRATLIARCTGEAEYLARTLLPAL